MIKTIAAITLAVMISTGGASMEKIKEKSEWTSLGGWRVTHYCRGCSGNINAMGNVPRAGTVAMNGVPLGTIIKLNGIEYVVEDRCGIDGTVDIFQETETCQCSHLSYEEVFIKNE